MLSLRTKMLIYRVVTLLGVIKVRKATSLELVMGQKLQKLLISEEAHRLVNTVRVI